MKLPFDYFVIAQPATGPLIFVQQRGWLECGDNSYGGENWWALQSFCTGCRAGGEESWLYDRIQAQAQPRAQMGRPGFCCQLCYASHCLDTMVASRYPFCQMLCMVRQFWGEAGGHITCTVPNCKPAA